MDLSQPAAPVEAPRWTCAVCGALSATTDARFCSRCGEPNRPDVEAAPPPDVAGAMPLAADDQRRRPVLITAAVAGAVVLLAGVLTLPAWLADRSPAGSPSMAGAGPQHTSHFPGPAPSLDEIAWSVLVGPPGSATAWRLEQERGGIGFGRYRMGWSPQLVDADGVYYADDSELVAVDGDTGMARWRFALEPDGSASSIVLAGPDTPERPSRIVVGGGASTIGLDTVTGEVRWSRETDVPVFDTHVMAAGSRVLVQEIRESGMTLIMLEAETGAEIWTVDIPERFGVWAAGADEETVLLIEEVADGPAMRALEANDGSERWAVETGMSWPTVHALRDGRIFLSHWRWEAEIVSSTTTGTTTTTESVVEADAGEHYVTVIDAATGAGLWENTFLADPYGGIGIGVGTDHLYLSSSLGLHAHDAATGEIVWERSDGRWWVTGTGPDGGELHALRLDDANASFDPRSMDAAVRSGRNFEVHNLDPVTGATLWHRDHATRDPWPTDILLSGYGRSYISHPDGRSIHDSATGEVTGWHLTRSPDDCTPIVTGEAVVVPGVDALYSVDRHEPDPPRPLRRLGLHESATGVAVAHDLVAALVVDTSPTMVETRLYTDWGMLEPAAVFAGRPSGTPVLSDRSIYLAGSFRRDNVMKLHPRTGSVRWRTRVAGTVIAAPTVAAGHVHVPTDRGIVTLDTESGDEVWTAELDGLHGRAPVRVGGVVLASTDSRVVAFDVASGDARWDVEVDGQIGHGIAAAHGRAYVATADGLVALSVASGERRWFAPLDAPPTTGPVVSRGQVVLATGPEILAVDGATGRVRSALDAGAFLVGDLVMADGSVYACSMEGALVAVR